MKLGLSTYTFPWSFGIKGFVPEKPFTYKDLINKAGEYAVSVIQFGDNYPLHVLNDDELEDLKQLADKRNIEIQVGTRGIRPALVDHYLNIATRLGSPFIRTTIDNGDDQPGEQEVSTILLELIPALEQANVQLIIENHDRFKAHILKQIVEETDTNWIGVCLDTANSLGAGEGLDEVVQVLCPYTRNVHIKDFRICRVEHKMGFRVSGAIAGEGMLNIPVLLDKISSQSNCDSATLEIWSEPEATLALTIEKEMAWANKSIHYLKTLIQ